MDEAATTPASNPSADGPPAPEKTAIEEENKTSNEPAATSNTDADPGPKDVVDGNPEPMETDSGKEPDDGVVDVSGIIKDIDDFNRSAEPTPPGPEESKDEAMDVNETPTESSKPPASGGGNTGEESREEEGPDTSQVIAALKNLESYDDVDSRESNEPEQFSEDIVDEEKAPSAEKDKEASGVKGSSEKNDKDYESKDDQETKETAEKEDLKVQEKTTDDATEKSDESQEKKDPEADKVPESSEAKTAEEMDKEKEKETTEGAKKDSVEPSEKLKEEKVEEKDDKSAVKADAKSTAAVPKKGKGPQTCIVCKKVGKCKYNIVRNGDIKHLCDDNCFKVFRANPTSFLRSQPPPAAPRQTNGAVGDGDDDVKVVGESKIEPPRHKTRMATGTSGPCSVCKKVAVPKHEISYNGQMHRLCGDPCFAAFRYANKLSMNSCENCQAILPSDGSNVQTLQYEGQARKFCTLPCLNSFKSKRVKNVPCVWCGTRKSNFDMVERVESNNKFQLFCTLNCLSLYRVNLQATSNQNVTCDQCLKAAPAQYHLTMSDASVRNFCTYNCVMAFQGQFSQPGGGGGGAASTSTRQSSRQASKGKNRSRCEPCSCALVTPKIEPGLEKREEGKKGASDASVRRNTPRAARKKRSFSEMYESDGGSDPEYDPKVEYLRSKKSKGERSIRSPPPVLNGTSSKSSSSKTPSSSSSKSRRPSRSKRAYSPEPEPEPRRSSGRDRKSSHRASAQSQAGIQISSVRSLAPQTSGKKAPVMNSTGVGGGQVIVQPPPPKDVRNKSLLCKPFTQTKATSCRPHTQTKETQTEGDPRKVIIPVPIPFYVPVPMAMYSAPQPYPLPVPVPIPVPYFIPTTKKSADSILKHIKEIQERMPADPFEAELLMMAEAVAVAEKGSDDSSDESDTEGGKDDGYRQQGTMQGGEFGEDMLQMALRMAQEMPDEALDLEHSINPSTINPDAVPQVQPVEFSTIAADTDVLTAVPRAQSRKRRNPTNNTNRIKNRKRIKSEDQQHDQPPPPPINQPPPDANMVLKYTYGVNAWKHWVVNKNQQLQQTSSGRRLKGFKTDILQCTADELNYSLCLFVKEVRKPNGDEYAPDSIYYLCLGIQQYLFENSRIDNIFTDIYFEKFTDCLNEVLQKYEVRLNTAGLIVCRIEEEHLWESKQLGAHSPHVLLNTLIYFNTKYFMLKTPEEHLRLSFSHIMKHWKKTNIPGSKTQGRSVYLRYYAPVPNAKVDAQKRKREELPVFEQGENVENPLRCPVKLYEFYLSKAPESIKNRNDVFYLVPERSCVPDSPVWYSTGNLGIEAMTKMLNRTRVVREIQEAHLHHQPMYGLH